jgi:RNA processing factor Prp31
MFQLTENELNEIVHTIEQLEKNLKAAFSRYREIDDETFPYNKKVIRYNLAFHTIALGLASQDGLTFRDYGKIGTLINLDDF